MFWREMWREMGKVLQWSPWHIQSDQIKQRGSFKDTNNMLEHVSGTSDM